VRPAPGPQLGAGRVRVDAARAIAKLREYQLADRTAWVLEAIRAGVAAGATALELRGDANDIWLAWRGPPLPDDDVLRLFDELVSPEPASERHHVRLLAAAVNSALGANPAHVDVIALVGDGSARRVRYTPEVLAEPDAEEPELDAPLRRMTVEAVALPDWFGPGPGMVVHLRRAWSLRSLGSLFWEREPAELALARVACRDIAVPLRIGADTLVRDDRRDVVQLPLGEGLDGHVAIVDPDRMTWAEHAARLEVAERGVVIARYAIELGVDAARAPVPIRLYVDAPRMPTNASRSEVRRDLHPLKTAYARARVVVREALDRLAVVVERDPEDRRARAAALAVLASAVASPELAEQGIAVRPPLKKLGALPLVRDATGEARPITSEWSGLVHTGRDAFPDELAPWLANVLWVAPGDPSARLIVGRDLDTGALRRYLREARRQRRAERRFFEHAPRAPEVAVRNPPRVRLALGQQLPDSCVPARVFEQIAGEVVIDATRTGGELVLLLHGREIERKSYDSPIGFEAVVDSARLAPLPDYRGVSADAELARVERAVCAGVLCAIEQVASERGLDGRDLRPAGSTAEWRCGGVDDADARLIRHGIALARELQTPLRAPLATAAVWPTARGELTSIAALRGERAIGFAPHGTEVAHGERIVVYAGEHEPALLWAIAPVRAVRYDLLRSGRTDARALARLMAVELGHALIVEDGALCGAIAVAPRPYLVLHHMGAALGRRPYVPVYARCAIAVDSNAIVPDDHWRDAADDAGLAIRDYSAWERALLQAAARALIGVRPDALVGLGDVTPESPLVRGLVEALAQHDPAAVLGGELVAQLCAHRWLRVHGDTARLSPDEVAARFADGAIPYLDGSAAPVLGWTPLVGDATLAHAVGALLGRDVRLGTAELEQRRREGLRAIRLMAVRGRPAEPVALPGDDPRVELETAGARGVVGVGDWGVAISIYVEGRPYMTLERAGAPPLRAALDVSIDALDFELATVAPAIADALIAAVERTAGPLLIACVRARPEVLAEAGPVGELLARAALDDATRLQLAAIARFPTVQGEPVSIEHASGRANALYTAAWHGHWLPPEPGAAASALDEPVLHVAGDAEPLRATLRALYSGAIVDVTDELAQLQSRRRMAHGLVPMPTVQVAPRWKRTLAELGSDLGVGEIGLVEHAISRALIHEDGDGREGIVLDVLPPIDLAVEAPHLLAHRSGLEPTASALEQLRALRGEDTRIHALGPVAQELALALVRRVLAEVPIADVPPSLRKQLALAVLLRRLPASEVATLPLFETPAGDWVTWQQIEAQHAELGDIWAVPSRTITQPLDERRLVLRLAALDIQRAQHADRAIIDATEELELDERARKNRARPPAQTLAIEPRDGVLAEVQITGEPTRGVVAILSPDAAARRALVAHRELHPFDPSPDPCRWPTLANVEDPRLVPDRAWEHPVADTAWAEVSAKVRAASARAVTRAVEAPAHALVSTRLTMLDTAALRGRPNVQLCGTLWLVAHVEPTPIEVHEASGMRSFVPRRELGLAGTLYVHAPDGWPREDALGEVVADLHPRLLRALPHARGVDAGVVAAHVAHGLALDRIGPRDARKVTFDCFLEPLDAAGLQELLRGTGGVDLVDDDSQLARVLRGVLGERVAGAEKVRAEPARPAEPHRSSPSAHPVQAVLEALARRLFEIGVATPFAFAVDDREQPILRFDGSSLRLAGDDLRMHALANALAAQSPWAAGAIDALAAHAVTVLNIALTQITDATEAQALSRLLAC
jgi:hypothetical protein